MVMIRGNKASKKRFAPGQASSGRHRCCNTVTLTPGEHPAVFFHPSNQAGMKDQPVDYYGQEKRNLAGKEESQDRNFSRQ